MMLELRDIYKTYLQGKMEVPVLGGISLSVEEGEYVAIMGPSGSGKTTLMNIIGCLDSPTSGEYILDGEDIAKISEKRMSEVRLHSIGFVFQSFYLLSRQSALDNVALPLLYAGVRRRERQEIARKALERVGLGDRTEFKPTQLSGGQCQRVAIARSIVNSPKILLADEPTGALDTKSGEQIMEIFQRLNDEGVTIVMITHEPEIAAHAKRTLHIRDGLLLGGSGQDSGMPHSPAATQAATAASAAHAALPRPAVPTPPAPAPSTGQRPLSQAGGPAPTAAQQPDPSQKGPAAPQSLPQAGKAPESKPRPEIQKAPNPEKAPGPEKPQEPEFPDEEPISGQSIIAALERQLNRLTEDLENPEHAKAAPEGGEEPSHEQ